MPVIELNDSTISQLNGEPCIIDFYADWCTPCKMMSPMLEETSSDNQDITFFKVNVENNPEITNKYKIANLPTILFMQKGLVVEKSVGTLSKKQLREKMENIKIKNE